MEKISIFDQKFKAIASNNISFMTLTTNNEKNEVLESTPKLHNSGNPNNLSCSYCKIQFTDQSLQRIHYKLDWHRYNLKQHLLNRQCITAEQFNDKTDDISSISGSDTEEEDSLDNLVTAQGKIFIKNGDGKVFSCYRCLCADKKASLEGYDLAALQSITSDHMWAVFMLGGGHFAGAIFHGNKPILHKTFHCYTVRAGQGGTQSTKDNKSAGSGHKSAGASLRRYNENALALHVRDIIDKWKEEIQRCNLIIYRAAGPQNRNVIFGSKTPVLDKNNPGLRTIPFSTRRATFKEVKRVHELLSTAYLYDTTESAIKKFTTQKSPEKQQKSLNTLNRSKSRELPQRPLPCTASESDDSEDSTDEKNALESQSYDDLVMQLVEIPLDESLREFADSLSPEQRKIGQQIRKQKKSSNRHKSKAKKLREKEQARKAELMQVIAKGDLDTLLRIFKTYEDPGEIEDCDKGSSQIDYVNEILDDNGSTLLHVAAQAEQIEILKYLLTLEANVCLKNNKQQTAYSCTQSKFVRDVLKDYAKENPDKYNYNKAQIPLNLSTQTPEELAEKKRTVRKVKKEKEKEKKKEQEIVKIEQRDKDRFLQLSDREKRALAAERRILSQSGSVTARCFLCATDISGKVPFEYMGNRFCTIICLKAHRMQYPIALS